jgi:nicotinate-nucleotide adenylyltransferase
MNAADCAGVLGGTFDPVHLGHLYLAEQAAVCLGLAKVFLIPSSTPPHKPKETVTSTEHRLAMLRLAVADRPRLDLSAMEMERGGVSYTIQTLRSIRDSATPFQPVFLIGSDALWEINTWKEFESILSDFDLAVVDRPGSTSHGIPEVEARLVPLPSDPGEIQPPPGAGGRIFSLPVPPVRISSTMVRKTIATGNSLDGLVPDSVAKYIHAHRLYRREARP